MHVEWIWYFRYSMYDSMDGTDEHSYLICEERVLVGYCMFFYADFTVKTFVLSFNETREHGNRLIQLSFLSILLSTMIAAVLHGLITLAFLIGLYKIFKLLHTLFAPCFYFNVDLSKRYSGGWALITGASEGIGYAVAEELARRGFNLILASRSLQKLQDARTRILEVNPKVEVEVRSVDFEKLDSEQDYKEFLRSLEGREISILVNNVGYYLPHAFGSNSFSDLRREMRLNCLPPAILSRLLLPQLISRPRSALLNISSAAALAVYSGAAHYAATKTFDDFLSLTIAQEYGSKLDVLTARPFIVTTPMTRNIESPLHCSPRKCAEAIVQQLPRGGISYGPLIHRLQGALVELVGGKIAGWVMGAAMKQFEAEYNKRA